MRLPLLAVFSLGACVPSSSVARLADLPDPHITGGAGDHKLGLGIDYDNSAACFALSSSVHATADDQPMIVTSRGGSRDTVDGNVCDPITLQLANFTGAAPMTAIRIMDGKTTWSLDVEGLAPSHWTLALTDPANDTVTEGQQFTVRYAPASSGVKIGSVAIDRDGINPMVAQTDDSATVRIEDGLWSSSDSTLHGKTIAGTLSAELGPLVVHGCEALAGCNLSTQIPDPGLPISIVIP